MANIPDLDGVEAADALAPMAPPGRYLMLVIEAEEDTKKETGNTSHFYTYSVCGGPNHGKIARQNFNISHDVGKSMYKGFLAAIGFTSFKGLTTDAVKGRPVLATVVEEQWTAKSGKNAGKVMHGAKAIEFANAKAEWEKYIAAMQGGTPAAEGAAGAGATAGATAAQLGF